MLFRQITDSKLAQNAYLIGCQRTGEALVVDPERDVDRYLDLAAEEDLRLVAAAETHIHADFLSGARELGRRGLKVYLSDEGDSDWKYGWASDSGLDVELLRHGDCIPIGKIELQALHTPGHTPEHLSFLVTDRGGGAAEPMGLLSGDFVFVGDVGRPDLLESAAGEVGAREPAARALHRSLLGFLKLPEYLQVWPAHGAGSACGKALGAVPSSTVGYELRFNGAIADARAGEETFVRNILEGQPEPPLYFGRMKQLNRDGVPLLDSLPTPRRMPLDEIAAKRRQPDVAVLDTRGDRRAFMTRHLPGSLHVPLDSSFATISGSYVRPNEQIFLLVEPQRVEEACRALIRIGLDRVEGFAGLADLETYDGETASTEVVDFDAFDAPCDEVVALDVRGAGEYASGHVEGAVNIAHTRLLDRLDEVPRDRPLYVYCATGRRAAAAASMLERAGFRAALVDDVFRGVPTTVASVSE